MFKKDQSNSINTRENKAEELKDELNIPFNAVNDENKTSRPSFFMSIDEFKDEAKAEAEQAASFINDTAKVVGDFTDAQVKQASVFIGDAAKAASGFANSQLKQAMNTFGKVKLGLEGKRSQRNLEKYRPVFLESVEAKEIPYPRMISVVDSDVRMSIPECQGAIGYQQQINDTEILTIYRDEAGAFSDLEFYPDRNPSASMYYVHPLKKNQYIEITEYFSYLKEQRVRELEDIAQELGAKYFKVQIIEEVSSNDISKAQAKSKLGIKRDRAGVDVSHTDIQKQYQYEEIAAEMTYPGKEPNEPALKLWANNESIKSLIKQRLSSDNPLQKKVFRLDYNTSSGIKEHEAAKIDGVLKVLKFNAAGKIQKEAQKESRKRLEYTIEF